MPSTRDTKQWFHDDEFNCPLPSEVAESIAQFYGTGDVGMSFAQMLASFLAYQHRGWVLVATKGASTRDTSGGGSMQKGSTPENPTLAELRDLRDAAVDAHDFEAACRYRAAERRLLTEES